VPWSSTEQSGLRSITRPRVVERPAKQCPPLRVAIVSPKPCTSAMASTTSAGVLHRTIAAGRSDAYCANAGFRASSYAGESGRIT
jgi:hypothetical protein